MDKEAYWLENKGLPSDEIQRRWALRCADVSAVVGPRAPTQPVQLEDTSRDTFPDRNESKAPFPAARLGTANQTSVGCQAVHALVRS